MLNKFKKQMKNEKGLTLIELLAVIVILAIIAAIAIPAIGSIIDKQRDKAELANASLIINGAKLAIVDGACATGTCTGTVLQPYVEGVKLDDADTVVKTGTDSEPIYTLIWGTTHVFKKITAAEAIKGKNGATETQIQGWMGK